MFFLCCPIHGNPFAFMIRLIYSPQKMCIFIDAPQSKGEKMETNKLIAIAAMSVFGLAIVGFVSLTLYRLISSIIKMIKKNKT